MYIAVRHPIQIRFILLFGAIIGFLSVIVSMLGLFTFARLRLGDSFFVSNSTSDNIVIIALDDLTLNEYGRTPTDWSRNVYTELVTTLTPFNPRVVVFDLLFSNEKLQDTEFASALNRLRQNDARTRIVLATAGINPISRTVVNRQSNPSLIYQEQIPLSPPLEDSADYLGYTNVIPDVDNVIRRQPSLIQADRNTGYSLSIATYLAFLRVPSIAADQVIMRQERHLNITSERTIPIDLLGFWQPFYFGEPANDNFSTFPIISLLDVIDERANLEALEDKIVLIGLIDTIDLLDQYVVPSSDDGTLMSGVEVHAHAVESIIRNQYVKKSNRILQSTALFGTAIICSMIFAYVRWHYKLMTYALLIALIFFVVSVIFSYSYILIDFLDFILLITVIFIITLGFEINFERHSRQETNRLLESVQKIAAQQLDLEQAAIYILDDVRKLVPQTSIRLYLNNLLENGSSYLFVRYNPFYMQQTTLVFQDQPDTFESLWTVDRTTTFKLIWRNKEYGKLVIQKPANASQSIAPQIQNLIDQLAPHVANLLQHDAILQQKLLLNAVITDSPAAVVICDRDGRIIQQNDLLMDLLNLRSTPIQSKSILRLLESRIENEAIWRKLQTSFKNSESVVLEEVRLKNRIVSLSASPIGDYDVWGIILNDVSGIVELSDLKTHLMRLAAHDLKNPLSRITLFSSILKRKINPDEKQNKYIESIIQSSNDMTRIINDILNVERLRSNQPEFEPVDLVSLIQEAYLSHIDMAKHREQNVQMDLPTYKVVVNVDTAQILQVVSNLIGNAIKYSPNGGHIRIRLIEKDHNLTIEVEDNGYGIPVDAQKKIFTQFYRAHSDVTAHIKGTGLGLHLVKTVVMAHGGMVGFKSEEAVGSTFYFTLPKHSVDVPHA